MTNLYCHTGIRGAVLAARRAVASYWLAGAAGLMSGGFMTAAGYLLRTEGSRTASVATIPGGVLIAVAFRLAGRGQSRTQEGRSGARTLSSVRTGILFLANLGLPEDLTLSVRLVALSLAMAAGAVMVFAGYTGAAQSWMLAAILAVIGGLLICAAFALVATAPTHSSNPT